MTGEAKTICQGALEHRGRHLSVDCTGCAGPRSLSDRVCFMGLSGRITPGFNGDIVLCSDTDSMYRGPIVEALSACSEIRDLISSLASKGASRKERRLMVEVLSSFEKDPRSLLAIDDGHMSDRVDPRVGERTGSQLLAISERARRMIARLEG